LDYYGPMHRTQRLIAIAALLTGLAQLQPAQAATPAPVVNSDLNAGLMYQILLAEISSNNGDDINAFSLMLDAARKSNSVRLYERSVELALRARKADYALEAARAWQRAYPTSREANRYVLQLLIGINRLGETGDTLKRSLQGLSGKERIQAISLIPRYFPRASDKALAATIVEQALAGDLASSQYGPSAWAAVGSMRLAAGNAAGALAAAQKGSAIDTTAEEPAVLALNLMEAKTPGAEAIVQSYLATKPLPDIRMAYGRTLIGEQRFADALAQMKAINQQAPDYADAWLMRGTLEAQEKDTQDGETSLKKYLSVVADGQPNGEDVETQRGAVQAYLLLAQIAEQKNKIDEAMSYLDRIKSRQDSARVMARRATLLARQGKLEEALRVIRSAPEVQPEDVRTKLSTEIGVLREFKKFDDAYALLGQAVKSYPDDTTFAYDRAMMAEKLGLKEEMERQLRQLIALAPDYYHAYNALGYSLADRNVRLPEARQLIQKALEFAPNDPFIIDSLAWVEFRSGKLTDAQRLLEQAFASRKDPEIAAHLGEVLWAAGQRDEAVRVWRQGLELQRDNETLQETIKRLKPSL
jgi:tetratricopeptide (TPR) repeat protein